MWVTVRRTGWRCSSLMIAGYTVPSTVRSSTVFEPGAAGHGVAQVAAVDGDRERRHAVAVDHAGIWFSERRRRDGALPVWRPVLAMSTVDAWQ